MNPANELIRLYAKQLKIPTFAEYQEILRQADPSATFPELLLELMKAETLSRQENQNKRRLKAAGFPYLKTLEEFDCTQLNDAVSPLFLQELASCQFIQDRQNIVMIGNPGRGKTHLSIALGLKACTQGYRVLFKDAATLSTELCEAKDVFDCAKAGDALALDVVNTFGEYMGKALACVSCVCDPDVFVLGGGVSAAGQIILDVVQASFRRHAFPAAEETRFELASLGNDAGICGAAKLILG